MKKSLIILGIIIVLILLGVYLFSDKQKNEEQVFCTMDAKMCPDGSFVGRIAPNCEFAPCPNVPETKIDFERNGVITANNPGQKLNTLFLIYEEPGSPALSKELIINEQSMCVALNGSAQCMAISSPLEMSFGGKRVSVSGMKSGEDSVLVKEIKILEE